MRANHFSLLVGLFLSLVSTALASTRWYVNGVNGNDSNDCKSPTTACKTIGHAISLASAGDTIGVGPARYAENLTINFSVTIVGSGATTTIVDGGGKNTVVRIPGVSAQVTLSKLTIQGGKASSTGGGIYNWGQLTLISSVITGNRALSEFGAAGGGIWNAGTLMLDNSTVSGNTATSPFGVPGYPQYVNGGGIDNGGRLTIKDSTITDNTATLTCYGKRCSASGGGIDNRGTAAIYHSTVSGNTVDDKCPTTVCGSFGGGIYNGGTLTLTNSTLSMNTARASLEGGLLGGRGGGISNAGSLVTSNSTLSDNQGGGIDGTATLQNTIVANNVFNKSGENCDTTLTSNGYNLSSDGTCNFNSTGDLNNTDPMLGPLQNNGGPTQTMALPSGSPAIDAGNPNGCTDGNGHLLTTDQRGRPRPDKEDKGGCDMGAYERQSD